MAGGEIALVEVQIKPFASTIERTLLYAEQALASNARRGDTLSEVTSAMPRVIAVNILEKELRKHGGFHQVVELLYREPPYERATDKLEIHNLELSKYRGLSIAEPYNALCNWLTAICRAQDEKKPLAEVVKMDAQLQKYCEQDAGFAQFVDRHGVVAATPEIRKAYRRWEYDIILDRLEEERKAAEQASREEKSRAEGKAEGKAEGMAEGAYRTQMNMAMAMLKLKSNKVSQTLLDGEMKAIGIPDEIVKAARKQYDELRNRHKARSRNKTTPE